MCAKRQYFLPPFDVKVLQDESSLAIEFVLRFHSVLQREEATYLAQFRISTKKTLESPIIFFAMPEKFFIYRDLENQLKTLSYTQLMEKAMKMLIQQKFVVDLAFFNQRTAFEFYQRYFCENATNLSINPLYLRKPVRIRYFTSLEIN